MISCLSQRQRDLVELAGGLADQFAKRAAEHDRDNTFPHENYADLRAAGLLRLTVPTELGGQGATLAEVLPVLERLAMGDASTALAVTMHISPLGQWATVWRRTGNPRLADLLSMAARDELIWASITGEPGLRNDMTDARTAAVKVDGGFRLSGRKTYATNTSVATHCSTTARWAEADGGPRLILCRIALDAPGVSIEQTWDTMGMRGTQSNDVVYDNVFVPEADVVHSLPIGHLDARVFETVWSWAMPAFASVYTGIAAGAVDWTIEQVKRMVRESDPLIMDAIAECQILIESSRALMYRHADEVESRRLYRPRGAGGDRPLCLGQVRGQQQRHPRAAATGRCDRRRQLHPRAAVRADVARRPGRRVHADEQRQSQAVHRGQRARRRTRPGDRVRREWPREQGPGMSPHRNVLSRTCASALLPEGSEGGVAA